MSRVFLLVALCAVPCYVFAQAPMQFEAEDVSSPTDAWRKDVEPVDKWNLWSKDKDAAKKWSGGVVLQSPRVLKDRDKPEDGAPVLHTVIKDIPKGKWVVSIKAGRGLAFSLDGKEWRNVITAGSRLGTFDIQDGKFEFWVDDRYADPKSPGYCYYDTITLAPELRPAAGILNGNFETGTDLASSNWTFWSRDGKGQATISTEAHSGKQCLKIERNGERDFAVTNAGRQFATPGQVWDATAWVKVQDSGSVELAVVALSSSGQVISWAIGSDSVEGTKDWKKLTAQAIVPDGCEQIYVRVTGGEKATAWVDDVELKPGVLPERVIKPLVQGYATQRIEEKMDRGLVAIPVEKGVYLSWRLLKADAPQVAFNLYRSAGEGAPVKLNAAPIAATTDFVDQTAGDGKGMTWRVVPVVNGTEIADAAALATVEPFAGQAYRSIKLQGDYTFQKAGIADLNGDGKYDFVLKQPNTNIDPASSYWTPSPDTYKLEAYLNDGTFLWRKDLGWSIERGIWYSPYVVYDFDGDGKAEVAVKTGEGDPRDPDGRVTSGPEYLSILDGMTGKELVRTDWPAREPFGNYNYASRNQMGVAYLDGKTPCLLVARGTYTLMRLIAYQWHDGKLTEVWNWSGQEERPAYRGQGAHFMHSADIDGDGRDEVILGSCVVDDNGNGLWSTGLGHPDKCYVTDLDPSRPGLEIAYFIEPGHVQNGFCVADAKTGKLLWGFNERTYHIGTGMTADVDPTNPGYECWGSEDGRGDPNKVSYNGRPPRWIFSSQGKVLGTYEKVPGTTTVWWDADPLREITGGGNVAKYQGPTLTRGMQGSQIAWADVSGDWREEIITSVPGELRIYSTTIPATDRRVCLMQDPIYRIDVAHLAMAYPQSPVTTDFIGNTAAALGLFLDTTSVKTGDTVKGKVVLAAPTDRAVSGTVTLTAPAGATVTPQKIEMKAAAGATAEAEITVTVTKPTAPFAGPSSLEVTGVFEGDGVSLRGVTAVRVADQPLKQGTIAEAETFTGQGGGEVQLREDKFGASGKSISHWDNPGHWLSWKVNAPAEGKYVVALRYCCATAAQRELAIDGGPAVKQLFSDTGGLSSATVGDWAHGSFLGADGKPLAFGLSAGSHTIKLTNLDGNPMNLDYLVLLPEALCASMLKAATG